MSGSQEVQSSCKATIPVNGLRTVVCKNSIHISDVSDLESHSVTRHSTQVNTPRSTLSQSRPVLSLPTLEGWKAELTWKVAYAEMVYLCPDIHASSNRTGPAKCNFVDRDGCVKGLLEGTIYRLWILIACLFSQGDSTVV